jgi:hypothetical protein
MKATDPSSTLSRDAVQHARGYNPASDILSPGRGDDVVAIGDERFTFPGPGTWRISSPERENLEPAVAVKRSKKQKWAADVDKMPGESQTGDDVEDRETAAPSLEPSKERLVLQPGGNQDSSVESAEANPEDPLVGRIQCQSSPHGLPGHYLISYGYSSGSSQPPVRGSEDEVEPTARKAENADTSQRPPIEQAEPEPKILRRMAPF